MWDFSNTTYPVAKKDYQCSACHWLCNSHMGEEDFSQQDWATIKKAEKDGWKVLKGEKYTCTSGMFEGEFEVCRARIDIDEICRKYDLYAV